MFQDESEDSDGIGSVANTVGHARKSNKPGKIEKQLLHKIQNIERTMEGMKQSFDLKGRIVEDVDSTLSNQQLLAEPSNQQLGDVTRNRFVPANQNPRFDRPGSSNQTTRNNMPALANYFDAFSRKANEFAERVANEKREFEKSHESSNQRSRMAMLEFRDGKFLEILTNKAGQLSVF